MLLTIAIADAYGAGFEFSDDEYINKHHCLTRYHSPEFENLSAGCYTDDTQMSIAICELVLNESGPWNKQLVAQYFLNVFKRDPRTSYSQDFYQFLLKTDTAKAFVNNINTYSVRNGSAMRSVPLGLIKNKTEMLDKARIQASLTHDTHEGIIASQAVALATFYFVNNIGAKDGLIDYIFQQTQEQFINNKSSRVACEAIDTLDAVFTVLSLSNSLVEIIDRSIKLGGDTDSVASIACGIAYFSDEFDKKLPEFLARDIENGVYGKAFLVNLNHRLMQELI